MHKLSRLIQVFYVLALCTLNFTNASTVSKRSGSPQLPKGLHFDIEPHTLDVWSISKDSTATQFLDALQKIRTAVQGTGLLFTADIPPWYSTVLIPVNATLSRPLSEMVMDIVDRVTLMDYRDWADKRFIPVNPQLGRLIWVNETTMSNGFSEGVAQIFNKIYAAFKSFIAETETETGDGRDDGIIKNALPCMNYANLTSKRIAIAVETLCGQEPSWISFCTQQTNYMEGELAKVTSYMTSRYRLVYDGLAVHDYPNWQLLEPAYTVTKTCSSLRDVWVWQAETLRNATSRQQLYNFCKTHAVRTIFANVRFMIENHKPDLVALLTETADLGISVEFLLGTATWALQENHAEMMDLVGKSITFIQELTNAIPAVGVNCV